MINTHLVDNIAKGMPLCDTIFLPDMQKLISFSQPLKFKLFFKPFRASRKYYDDIFDLSLGESYLSRHSLSVFLKKFYIKHNNK